MKAILISDHAKWCALMMNGDKTIEVRKTAPKEWKDYLSGKTKEMPKPIDVYIDCTKNHYLGFISKRYAGKVVAKFTLNKVEELWFESPFSNFPYGHTLIKGKHYLETDILKNSCLSYYELFNYLCKKKIGYAWHISNLVIFNKPKELSEFKVKGNCKKCKSYCPATFWNKKRNCLKVLTKAPQSYCYIETEE